MVEMHDSREKLSLKKRLSAWSRSLSSLMCDDHPCVAWHPSKAATDDDLPFLLSVGLLPFLVLLFLFLLVFLLVYFTRFPVLVPNVPVKHICAPAAFH